MAWYLSTFPFGADVTTCSKKHFFTYFFKDILLYHKLCNVDIFFCLPIRVLLVSILFAWLFVCLEVFFPSSFHASFYKLSYNLLSPIFAWELYTAIFIVLSLISPTGYFPLAYCKLCVLPSLGKKNRSCKMNQSDSRVSCQSETPALFPQRQFASTVHHGVLLFEFEKYAVLNTNPGDMTHFSISSLPSRSVVAQASAQEK